MYNNDLYFILVNLQSSYPGQDGEEREGHSRVGTVPLGDSEHKANIVGLSQLVGGEAEADKPHEPPDTVDNCIHQQ